MSEMLEKSKSILGAAIVSVFLLSGCQSYPDQVSNRSVPLAENETFSQQLARAVQNYADQVSNMPTPSTDDARRQQCTYIRSEIAKQHGIGDTALSTEGSIYLSPMEAAAVRAAVRQNVAALESKAADIQCSSAFSNAPVRNDQSNFDQCFSRCKQYTNRTKEQCFDACK